MCIFPSKKPTHLSSKRTLDTSTKNFFTGAVTGTYVKDEEASGKERGMTKVVYRRESLTTPKDDKSQLSGRPTPDFLPQIGESPTRGNVTIPWESEGIPTKGEPMTESKVKPEPKKGSPSTVHHYHHLGNCAPVHPMASLAHAHGHTWHQPCAASPPPPHLPCSPCPTPTRTSCAVEDLAQIIKASRGSPQYSPRSARDVSRDTESISALATAANVNAATMEYVLGELESVKRTCWGRSPRRKAEAETESEVDSDSGPDFEEGDTPTPARKIRRRK